jgi:hypothetical protein
MFSIMPEGGISTEKLMEGRLRVVAGATGRR